MKHLHMRRLIQLLMLSSLLAAALLSIAVVVLMDADRRAPGVAEFATALRFAPAALLAVGLGAWFATRWHARAHRAGRHWKAGGMTLRLLLVVLLLLLGLLVCVAHG